MQKSFDLLIKESENGDALSDDVYNNGLDHSDRQVNYSYALIFSTIYSHPQFSTLNFLQVVVLLLFVLHSTMRSRLSVAPKW